MQEELEVEMKSRSRDYGETSAAGAGERNETARPESAPVTQGVDGHAVEANTLGHEDLADSAVSGAADRQRARPRRLRRARWAVRVIVPAVVIGLWVIVTELDKIDPIFLPPPETIFDRAEVLGMDLVDALITSLQMVFAGFAIGGTLGIVAGLLFGSSRWMRDLFEFTVDTIRPIPLFALIPLFILWFGIGMTPQIALVALGVFLIMSLATIEAVRNVPQIYVRAALIYGASKAQIYKTVVVPAILPHMLTGARYAIAAAWGLDVAAEFTGSQEGLGYIMIVREQQLDTAGILLIVFIFCALALFFDRLVVWVARRLTRWTARSGEGVETELVSGMLGGR